MAKPRLFLFWLGLGLTGAFALAGLLAPWLAPYDPRLPVGVPLSPPTDAYLLGTNDIGQDTLTLLLYGARTSLTVAAAVAALSTLLSWAVGLAAGLFRPAESLLMPITDLLLALPGIPIYLLVVTILGPSLLNLILLLAFFSWPSFARTVRGLVIGVRSADYVDAAYALGGTGLHVALRHVLPVTLDILPTKLILTVRFAVFMEATLAFLGVSESGSISWGTMLGNAFNDPLLFNRPVWPWLVLPPGVAIMAVVLGAAWLSNGIDVLLTRGWRPGGTAPRDEEVTDVVEDL